MDEDEIELEEFEGEKEQVPSSRVRTAVSIVKPGKGGMVIDASTDGLSFLLSMIIKPSIALTYCLYITAS